MTREIKLSKRLQNVAEFITPGVTFADIGSDHAYLPCYLCMHDSSMSAIAGEVQMGPYNSAKKTVNFYNMADQVDVRFGDGLEVIDENITEIVIAGMGGSLIQSILDNGSHKLGSVQRLVIQPNNHAEYVRNAMLKYNYTICDEIIMEENKRIYEIIVAVKDSEADPYSPVIRFEKQQLFGPLLMQEKNKVFKRKWTQEILKIERILQTMEQSKQIDMSKVDFFKQQRKWIEEVLENDGNQSSTDF